MSEEISARHEEPLGDLTTIADPGLAAHLAIDALNPATGDEARAFLSRQARLAEKQSKLADEQMRFMRLRTKYYAEDLGIERLEKILKITVQVLLILTGIVIVIGFGALVWWASHSQSVVMEEFDAPPSLAQKGDTGRVVASGVLDELTKLQSATRATAAKLSLKNAWTGDIKIDIPETGVSLGELERTLRDNLGNDLHIGGSLVETPEGGLALSVRGDGIQPKTFSGTATELPKLMRQAAEYIYGEAEPYLYSTVLLNTGRYEESQHFIERAYPHARPEERPQLLNILGNTNLARYKPVEAIRAYRLAIALKPRFWKSWGNLVGALSLAQGEEASWRAAEQMRALAKTAPRSDQPRITDYENATLLEQDWQATIRAIEADNQAFNGVGSMSVINGPLMADAAARLHDWQTAAEYLAESDPDDAVTRAEADLLPGYRALERGDYAAGIPHLEAFYKRWLGDPNLQFTYDEGPCWLGLAYTMTGRTAEADAVFKRTGPRVRCSAMRAEGIEHSGDWHGAIAAYRAAIALAPSLPLPYDAWGLALMRHGDLNGASAAFRQANKRGPHWAEPLKHWGDVLRQQHRPKEALAKYNEALKIAPKWDALIAARAVAAH